MQPGKAEVKSFIEYCKEMLFTPYVFGGNAPFDALDCSGFVIEALKAFGFLHRNDDLTAQDLAFRLAKNYERCEPREGAILFFGNQQKITHVAVAVNDWQSIGAEGGDSACTTIELARIKSAYVKIRPISSRGDFLFAIGLFSE